MPGNSRYEDRHFVPEHAAAPPARRDPPRLPRPDRAHIPEGPAPLRVRPHRGAGRRRTEGIRRDSTPAGLPEKRLRSRTLRVSYITHRLLSLDEGRPVTTEMVRQEVGHSASSKTIERVYARVSARRQRLDPFAFRIEAYVDLPEIRAALDQMAAEDSAAAARAAVPKPERERIEAEERLATIRAFLNAVDGLSNRAVQEATAIAYRTVGRLRSGEQSDARGRTLRRMNDFLARHNEKAASSPSAAITALDWALNRAL